MNSLLLLALRAADAANIEVMDVYSSSFDFAVKGDGSPVTEADMRAHTAISKTLAESSLPVLSEEDAPGFEERRHWQRFWLVDPLDGTKDFIARNDGFTINIALIEHGEPVLGVISAPATSVTWFSAKGEGAWKRTFGTTTAISATGPWPSQSRMAVSVFHDAPASAEFGLLNGVAENVKAGSALKFGLVADGSVEFYPRFNGSSEWDIAAGDAVIREAGGFLATLDGTAPRYNKDSLRNPFFIAWRPPLRWQDIRLPATSPS